jgi:hypothetical protein
MSKRPSGPGLVVVLGVLLVGCAGANVQVTAPSALYPISMSDTVRDDSGTLLDVHSMKIVSGFHLEATRVGILYSGVMPHGTLDISDAVNAQVSAAQGDAVVRLSVTVEDSCNVLNTLPVLNAIPFWPGCVPVVLDGLIIRRRPPSQPALPSTAPFPSPDEP